MRGWNSKPPKWEAKLMDWLFFAVHSIFRGSGTGVGEALVNLIFGWEGSTKIDYVPLL